MAAAPALDAAQTGKTVPEGILACLTPDGNLASFIREEMPPRQDSDWAWRNFRRVLLQLMKQQERGAVLEIGGGRKPLFSREECAQAGVSYSVNDISLRELEMAPEWASKLHFDIAGNIDHRLADKFDLIFSRMVLEHVDDARRTYANMYYMLRPGGICLNFHPTLYSLPFLLNHIFPETISRRVLGFMFSDRRDEKVPKFPARYKWCYATRSQLKSIKSIGFREVAIIPFYGHSYYGKIPVLRSVHNHVTQWALNHRLSVISSYAYTIARK